MKPLYDAVLKHASSGALAFHTPGHKLGKAFLSEGAFFDAAAFDLTELPDTDNLHHPEGPILRAQELAAIAFHSARTWFLVNGATCGVHAMIMAACPPGGKLIISRDFHMSAYNGMMLAGARPCFVYPATPQTIRRAADENPDASAVYVTRPSYYGDVCELERIVEIAHSRKMRVLVDEAHGAHFAFSDKLPMCAMDLSADLCVQSAHKTLFTFTQGAYLHASGGAAAEKGLVRRIEAALRSIQTSSPSFMIMSSLDYAREIMQERGRSELDRLLPLCEDFYSCMERAGYGVPPGIAAAGAAGQKRYKRDMTRLVLNTSKIGMTGVMAEAALFNKFNIRIEMSDINSIVMIATIADTKDDFEYLKNALAAIAAGPRAADAGSCCQPPNVHSAASGEERQEFAGNAPAAGFHGHLHRESEYTGLANAAGMAAAALVTPYPPGIPLLCPGEVITRQIAEKISIMQRVGIKINGIDGDNRICVYKIPAGEA